MKPVDLNGVEMITTASDEGGVVSAATIFRFEQVGNVVSARYRGGALIDGYLIGLLDGTNMHFRYVQADAEGHLDAGVSDGALEYLPDGRLRLVENFQWLTRPGSGTNIFEQVRAETAGS